MKPYIPDILGYKPFFIQTAEDSSALDTAKDIWQYETLYT
nr:MAG TPA: hypothetical protein [Caudoviricetes sp.]